MIEQPMDVAAANEAKTREYYEAVWNERRLELVDSWVTPDFTGYYSFYPEPLRGVEGFRGMVDDLLTAIPDARFTVHDTVAAGDKVVSRVGISGTHTGPLLGFSPTGQSVQLEYVGIERYVDGACAEEWVYAEDLKLSRQIGALPEAGSFGERAAQLLHRVAAARLRRKNAASVS